MNTKINEAVRKNVIYYRKTNNLTQAELAEKIGVSHDFIRQAEAPNVQKNFSIKTIEKLADEFEIDYIKLFENR